MSEDETCLVCGRSGFEHLTEPTPTYHYEITKLPDGAILQQPVLDGHFYLPRGEIGVEAPSEGSE